MRAVQPVWTTELGSTYCTSIEEFIQSKAANKLRGQVDLIFTSPPFPLVSPKAYGNRVGNDYLTWIVEVTKCLVPLLRSTGSLVMEIGNAWEKGRPTMSTLPLRTLLAIEESTDLLVCQQFIWENSAKLPGPATWVNRDRIRVKDSHTNIWWFSPTPFPKANNRRVLVPYSGAMKRLISSGKYNHGPRPSEHQISAKHFAKDNSGAIPGSTLIMSNTSVSASYRTWCQQNGLRMHPARMPSKIPEFFINFLTDPGDLVLDPFAGSNTTGAAAEHLGRRWLAIEREMEYVEGGIGRFEGSH